MFLAIKYFRFLPLKIELAFKEGIVKMNNPEIDLWADKYTFFWYNSPEIFHWTQEDFDKKAKQMHSNRITRVMTFSSTHFRFSFRPYWNDIYTAIDKIVKACHKYNIKVVEHHSSSLTFYPDSPEVWDNVERHLKVRKSNIEDFPGFKEYIMSNPELEPGIHLSDLYQIDGRNGLPAKTPYFGRAFCYNNPLYRKIYTEHLHEIAKLGVDAILADDAQFFGAGNSCTCKYCRALFKKQTGMELPSQEHWNDFVFNFNDPVFTQWLRFKEQSTFDFQKYLTERYEEWGISPYRPNYRSRTLARDIFNAAFVSGMEYWEHIFQENAFSHIIKYSWPMFYTESVLQYALARMKNVPSMSLFYPERYDQYFFSWALAESWGQIPFLCPEGENMAEEDKFFNHFEQTYAPMFRNQQKDADCAFLFSKESFDHAPNSVENTYYQLSSLMQAAYFNGLISDIVYEEEDLEAFYRQKCIISVGSNLITDSLADKLLKYLNQDGKLLIYGVFANFDPPAKLELLLQHKNVKRFPWEFGIELYQSQNTCYRMCGKTDPVPALPYVADFLRNIPGKQLRNNLPTLPAIEYVTIGFHANLYTQKNDPKHLTLHVLDLRDLLAPEGTEISHDDPLIHYCKNAPLNKNEIEIVLNRADIISGKLVTPSRKGEREVIVQISEKKSIVKILVNSFSGYAAIDLITSDSQ